MNAKLPPCPCDKRKTVDGIEMCYAIGCYKLGDMSCECPICKHNIKGICNNKVKGTKH